MKRFRKTIRHPETLENRKRRDSFSVFDYTLDLHGKTCDEAVFAINSALSSHAKSKILVIHGKGTGVLRLRVRAYLSKDPRVKRVEFGESSFLPGGDGVTAAYT